MRLNTEENLRRFLTGSKSTNYKKQKIKQSPINDQNINNIYTSTIYNQSKSNKNIIINDTIHKPFALFSKLSSRQKEKLNTIILSIINLFNFHYKKALNPLNKINNDIFMRKFFNQIIKC